MVFNEQWPQNRAYRTRLQRPNKCAVCRQVMPVGTRVVVVNGDVLPPDSPQAMAALEKSDAAGWPAWF